MADQVKQVFGSAVISECRRFRYALRRRWGSGSTAVFIMLNPSTADAETDDPTVRRCRGFAEREGCGGLLIENLFGFRTSSPDTLFHDEIGKAGHALDYILTALLREDGPVIAAWGGDRRASGRAAHVCSRIVANVDRPLHCLGRTKGGAPRHPLYLSKASPLQSFDAFEAIRR